MDWQYRLWLSWKEFEALANVEYDESYGAQEVADDLLVVGDDWWLERHEYDGSEWWEFKKIPEVPSQKGEIKTLIGGMWASLKELNNK